jgi:hypothetical protein
MRKYYFLLVKAAVCIGAIASLSFAGIEPSPWLPPIWKIIIIIIGG